VKFSSFNVGNTGVTGSSQKLRIVRPGEFRFVPSIFVFRRRDNHFRGGPVHAGILVKRKTTRNYVGKTKLPVSVVHSRRHTIVPKKSVAISFIRSRRTRAARTENDTDTRRYERL